MSHPAKHRKDDGTSVPSGPDRLSMFKDALYAFIISKFPDEDPEELLRMTSIWEAIYSDPDSFQAVMHAARGRRAPRGRQADKPDADNRQLEFPFVRELHCDTQDDIPEEAPRKRRNITSHKPVVRHWR